MKKILFPRSCKQNTVGGLRNQSWRAVVVSVALLILLLPFSRTFASERVLFELDGKEYRGTGLPAGAQLSLYRLDSDYYRKVQHLVDESLFDIYLKEEAAREGKTVEELRAARIAVEKPTEDEIRALYEAVKDRLGSPYRKVREQLAEHLYQRQVDNKKVALVSDYKEQKNFQLLIDRPAVPFVAIDINGFPVKGNPEAQVTIVDFADYMCPHCKTASDAINAIAKRLHDKVKVVYIDYLVTKSPVSQLVAQGAVCADKEGKFWPYHDLAYENQKSLSEESPLYLAAELALDVDAFEDCLQSEEAVARVKRGESEAKRLQLRSTPSVFINGKRIVLHDVEQDLIEAVEEALR